MKERRGRASKAVGSNKGRPPKLDRKFEEDLIAENQRLRMEIEYLKKRFFIKTGVQKNKERAIKLSIWYNVSDQTNIDRRELWLTYMIPQYSQNIKGFIAKKSKNMKTGKIYVNRRPLEGAAAQALSKEKGKLPAGKRSGGNDQGNGDFCNLVHAVCLLKRC